MVHALPLIRDGRRLARVGAGRLIAHKIVSKWHFRAIKADASNGLQETIARFAVFSGSDTQ